MMKIIKISHEIQALHTLSAIYGISLCVINELVITEAVGGSRKMPSYLFRSKAYKLDMQRLSYNTETHLIKCSLSKLT